MINIQPISSTRIKEAAALVKELAEQGRMGTSGPQFRQKVETLTKFLRDTATTRASGGTRSPLVFENDQPYIVSQTPVFVQNIKPWETIGFGSTRFGKTTVNDRPSYRLSFEHDPKTLLTDQDRLSGKFTPRPQFTAFEYVPAGEDNKGFLLHYDRHIEQTGGNVTGSTPKNIIQSKFLESDDDGQIKNAFGALDKAFENIKRLREI